MTEEKAEYTTEIAILDPKDITAANIELMIAQVEEIPEIPEDKDQYKTVKVMNIQVKKILPKIEARRKAIKTGPLMVCKRIDASAKKAVEMVQPLLLATSSRREAWEKIEAEEKAAERAKEKERQDFILAGLRKIKELSASCVEYGIESSVIKERIKCLEDHHVSEESYQEYFEEASDSHASGIIGAQIALKNRIKFEEEQAKAEAKRKADAEAQVKLEAANKAESDRLAKIAADQKAEAAQIKAKFEANVKKMAEEKAAFEAEKKALADAELARIAAEEKRIAEKAQAKADKEAAKVESERIKKRDELLAEALPIHIWDHVYPVALEMNTEIDRKDRKDMDASVQRKMDLIKDKDKIDTMTREIIKMMDACFDSMNVDQTRRIVGHFNANANDLIFDLNGSVAEIE